MTQQTKRQDPSRKRQHEPPAMALVRLPGIGRRVLRRRLAKRAVPSPSRTAKRRTAH